MTTTVDFFTTITVTNEHDVQVPRYTNPRARIDTDAYRRYTSFDGSVDVAILGDKTNHDPADPHAGVTADGVEALFDGLIRDVHMDDDPAAILAAAEGVLAGQGFALATAWVRDGNVYTADLTPSGAAMPRQRMANWLRARGVSGPGYLNNLLTQYAGRTEDEMDQVYAEMCGDMA